ncbi:flagellar basal body L-ring protein FlgH [Propylenella binzhouense]|uniref:Flagellar L-ring protein n=1 Tax=Propylenella binzhouense TaxID=2555902 RepID=A0A964T2C9_9HYPH|nr:flagellar basal body L-ring protein FlgH [Propylenella binzhouense]MYZ46975.1 flagellar basal body L-ring protein FlgH [Propylenella binzhouense]
MTRIAFLAAAGLAVSGCAGELQDFGREPRLSPVGSGLQAYREPVPVAAFPAVARPSEQSLWDPSRPNLFSNTRASKVGDIVTVRIAINDRATLDNASGRSREASGKTGLSLGFSLNGEGSSLSADGSADSTSKSNGKGSIDRSEKIELSIAAVVAEVLPNGNLLVSGSQEVRVNFEVRVLKIAGIVTPRDISPENTVPYDKIAEARISYGGRGRLTDVQQPAWGQRLYDAVTPY